MVKLPLPVAAVVTAGNSSPGVSVDGRMVVLRTMSVTLAEVADWPAESMIVALTMWEPSATEVESQL